MPHLTAGTPGYLKGLTIEQLQRLWDRLWQQIARGGWPTGGWDWITLSSTFPVTYAAMMAVNAEARSRRGGI